MKKILVFLCLCLSFLCSGCNQYNENNKTIEKDDTINMENKGASNEDIPTADIDTANKTNPSVSQGEIENNDLVTTNMDILSSSELVITYTNKTENTLSYGKGFILQVLNNDEWIDISTLPNVGWKDISLNLNAGESFDNVIDLKQSFGELKQGHYRIIKEMFMDSTKINVTVEFDI